MWGDVVQPFVDDTGERKKELVTPMLSMGGLRASCAIAYVCNPETFIR